MTKRKVKNPGKPRDLNAITVGPAAGDLERKTLRPSFLAAVAIKEFSPLGGKLDLASLVGELADQSKAASAGDLGRVEAMLTTQAHTLDTIFNVLAQRGAVNMTGGYMAAGEIYLRLALKAQSQCRTTIEALGFLKNPMAGAYVRQANIAAGHQQVNNGIPPAGRDSRARETEKPPNELLEVKYGETLDTRSTGAAGAFNSPVEAVGEIHRATDGGGHGTVKPKRR